MARKPEAIRERHSRKCAKGTSAAAKCSCPNGPSFEVQVWNRRGGKDGNGGLSRKTFSGKEAKRDAIEWRDAMRVQLRETPREDPTRKTLREACEEWLADAEAGVTWTRRGRKFKPATLRSYRRMLELHVFDDLGARRLVDVSASDVQRLIRDLTRAGLSGQSVRNCVTPLGSVFRAHRLTIPSNPTRDLDLPATRSVREWNGTPETTKELLAALDEDDRALWATAALAGLRRGELRALRVHHLHGLDGGVTEPWIRVEASWDDKEGQIAPKSEAGNRRTLMPESLRLILAEHVKRTKRSGDDLVFGRTAREAFTPTLVRRRALRAWAAANKKRAKAELAALVPVGLHELRHGFATMLSAASIDPYLHDIYVGHARGSAGARYVKVEAGQLRKDAAKLERHWNAKPASVTRIPTRASA